MNAKSDIRGAAKAAQPARRRAKRMPAAARKAVILKEACDFFAQRGFEASTRDLADRIGVRQALLYKYFPSKEALIDSIFDSVIKERKESPGGTLSADKSKPLVERVFDFYQNITTMAEGSGTRLASRAALEDLPVSARLSALLNDSLFKPVIAELREMEKLPDLAARPMLQGENELLMALHSAAMFYHLRRDLKNMPPPENADEVMRLNIGSFLAGVRASMRELHAGQWSGKLTADAPEPAAHLTARV